ncbi:hypothetical protein A4G16_08595 [Mannheimia granulomatis]|uniref:Autotransporter adhesin n=1 Tax=Mannheimia granulomatis TaxID=85402 RepID=A0A6G8JJT4_9PAST|nr:YadA-like family protein [Mannheimia granulomatis]QIM67417.1 hypothetical protein A4G16_08595 [Mannheimia granulomatis]
MNKIFKVIFNRTTQKMEVVSELARSHGKATASTDERGGINLAVGILSGATFIGGMAAFILSAAPVEAAVIINSITGSNGNLVITTNSSVPTTSSTNPYNYFNPGSLSYDQRTEANATNRLLYKANTTSAIVLGEHATALEDKNGARASGVAIGDYSHAGGALSIAIGPFSRTADTGSIALGTSARSEGFNSFAAMRQSAAIADYSAAIGSSSWANETASFAIGASATALGARSFAIGSGTPQTVQGSQGWENKRSIYDGQNNTLAAGTDAFSIGTKAKTNGNRSFAIGTNAWSGGFKTEKHATLTEIGDMLNPDNAKVANDAFALGTNSRAESNDSVAFSTNATANGEGSIAFGVNTNTTGTGAIAFGNASKAWKNNAISIGWNATSHAEKVISIGSHSNASKDGAMAIGDTASSSGNNSVAIGYSSTVSNANATAIGTRANITHEGGTAIGFEAESKANYATAIAYNSTASGENSIAAGVNSSVSGTRSAALGYNNNVSGNDTFVLGSNVTVSSVGSVVLGSDSAQANATKEDTAKVGNLTYSGFAGDENVVDGDYVSIGNSTNARQIKFVAPGNISATSTDAINGSQLYATNDMINNVTTSIKDNFGGNATVNPNGTITYTDIGGTGKDTIHDAIKAAKTEVKQGSNVNVAKTNGDDGHDIYTVNAYNTTVSASTNVNTQGLLEVNGTFNQTTNTTNYEVSLTQKAKELLEKDTVTGVMDDGKGYVNVTKNEQPREGETRTYTVDLSENTKNKIDNALSEFTVGADKNATANGVAVNKDQKRFDIVGGDNVTTSVDGRTIKVDLSDETKNTIKDNRDNIAKGFGLEAQDGKNVNKALGEKVKVVGSNSNINTTVDNGEVKINLNNTLDLTNGGSVTIGDTRVDGNGLTITGGPTVTKEGINAGDKKITNVSNGTISADSKDAVNGSQLHETNQNVTNVSNNITKLDEFVKKGFNITADNGTEDNVQLGQKITYTSTDKNIITTVTDNQIDFALNSTLSIGKVGTDGKDGSVGVIGKDGSSVVLNGKDGSIGLTGPKGADGKSSTSNITVKSSSSNVTTAGADGKNGTNVTRIVYDTPNGEEEVATLNDGLQFGANDGSVHRAKLNTQVNVKGAEENKEWSKFDQGQNIMTQINGNNITVALAKDVNLTEDGSVTIGGTAVNKDGITINNGPKITNKDGSVSVANQDGSPTKITNVKAGDVNNTSTDAVNGSQLYTVQEIANAGWNLTINEGKNSSNVKPKETVDLNNKDGNIQITKDTHNVTFALNNELTIGGPGKNGADGKDGSIGVKGADGSTGVALNGKDGSIGINGKDGANANITVKNGKPGVDGVDGTTKTRIVYETKDGPEEVATLNDGLRFTGNDGDIENKHKLNSLVIVKGEGVTKEQSKAFESATGNINVKADGQGNLTVQLAKNLNLTESGSVTIGGTNITNDGITINNGPKITNEGDNVKVGDKNGAPVKITNVKEGDLSETSKDAVNGSQLYATNQNVTNLSNKVAEGFNIDADNRSEGLDKADNVQLGETVKYTSTDNNVVTTVTNNTIDFGLADNISVGGKPGKDGTPGKDGQIGVKGADGKDGVTIKPEAIVFHGIDGVNGKNGIDGKDGSASIKVEKGAKGLDGNDGKDGESKTRIVYEKPNGEKEEVATLNDGLKFGANAGAVHSAKLNTQVDVKGAAENTDWTKFDAGKNVMTQIAGNTITVALAKDLAGLNSATFGENNDSTVINKDGITITKKDPNDATKSDVKLTEDGLSNGGNKITNVADGDVTETSKDAVNGSQLYQVQQTANAGWNISANGNNETNVVPKGKVSFNNEDGNIVISKTTADNNVTFALNNDLTIGGKNGKDGSIGVKGADGKDGVIINGNGTIVAGRDGKDGVNGVDGSIGANGKNGSSVVLNGKDGSIGLTGPRGVDGTPGASTNIAVKDGKQGVDGTGKDGLPGDNGETRIVYKNGEKTEEVANLNDGLIFAGNNEKLNRHKLNSVVNIVGEVAQGINDKASAENFKSAAGNINVVANEKAQLEIQLNKDLDLTDKGSVKAGNTTINNEGVTISKKADADVSKSDVKLTQDGLNNGGNQITNVDSGLKDKDGTVVKLEEATGDVLKNATNVGDLKNAVNDVVSKGFNIEADNSGLDNGSKTDHVDLGQTVKFTDPDSNIVTTVKDNEIQFGLNSTLSVGGKDGKPGEIGIKGADGKDGVSIKGEGTVIAGRDGKDGDPGVDGKVGAAGKDGSSVVLNGKDGSIGFTGPKGADGANGATTTLKVVQDGQPGIAGNDGKDGTSKTRIVYEKPNGDKEEVATLNDGLKFVGDDGNEIAKKLNETLSITGGEKDATKLSDANIGVVNSKDGLVVKLAKDLKDLGSATFIKEGEGEPKTVVNNNGITITPTKDGKNPVKLTEDGLDNGNNQIVNVKSGIDGQNGQDGQPVKSVNDLTDEQLEKVGTNAANIKDVRNATDALITKGFNIKADNSSLATDTDNVKLGETVHYTSSDKNIITTLADNQIDFALNNDLTIGGLGKDGQPGKDGSIGVKGKDGQDGVTINGNGTVVVGQNGKDGKDGIDGTIGVNGKDGSAVVLNGKDGSIGLNGKDGANGLTFKAADGAQGVDGTNGKDGLPGTGKDGEPGKTRIVYETKDGEGNPVKEEVATLNDGLIFTGNNEDTKNRHKLNTLVKVQGEGVSKEQSANFKSASGNINVKANGTDILEIQLNRELKDLGNATFVEYKKDENGNDVVNTEAPKTVVNNNGVTITPKDGKDGKDGNVVSLTKDGLNNGGNQIVNVKSGIDGLNGQNGKDGQPITSVNDLTPDQLKDVGTNAANINDVVNASNDIIEKGFSIAADNGETDHVKLGETVKYTSKDKNIITTVSDNVIDFALNNDLTVGGPGKDGATGKDGSIGVKGADGTAGVTLNGKDGSIGLTGPRGADGKDGAGATISVKDGAKGLDGNDGKNGESKTRIVYEKPDGKTEEVATLNDGLRFVGDDGKVIDKKLNETLQISGGDTDLEDLSDDNIGVVNKDGKLMVKLAKNIDLTDEGSITIGDTYLDKNVIGVGDSALTGDSLTVGGDNPITVDGNKGTIGGLTNKTFDPNNFTSGQAATEDQLKQVYDVANSGWDIAANGQNTTNVGPKGKVSFNNEDGNIIITKETTDNNVTFALNNNLTIGGPGKDGQPGKDGSIGVKGADGATGVTLNGKDGSIGINGKDGTNGTVTFAQGKPGVDGKDGETKSRIVYETVDKDGNPVKEEVATLNDGLKFVGDDGKVITKKLNETLSITGGEKDATKLSDANNIGVVNNNGTLTVKLAKDIDLTKDGSVTIGDTTVNNDGLTIKGGPSVTKAGINAGDKKITNVQDGEISETSKDAVNGSQLYQVQQVANAGWNLTANGKDKGNVKPGATVDLNNKDGNIVITKEGNNVTFGLNNDLTIGGKDGKDGQIGVAGKDGKDGVTIKGDGTITAGRDGKDGVDGQIGATGKDGASAVLNGKDGSIGLTGPKGADGKPGASANIAVKDGAEGVDGTNGKDGLPGENGKTRIVYETKDKDGKPVTEQVATLNDGLIFSGNNEDTKNRQKLNTEVKVKGEGVDKAASENFKSATGNINVKANGSDTLEIQLAKNVDLTQDGSVTVGDTKVDNKGLTIKNGPSVTKDGIDAKGTKITNVKDGDVTATSKDAVNGSQLYNAVQNSGWELTVNGEAESQRINNNGKVNIKAGRNVEVSRKGSTVEIATSSNPEFDTVKVGGTTLSSTVAKDGVNELNVAGKDGSATRITNVAPGVKGTDAVNVNQLRSVANHVNNVDKDLRAGVAGALAAGNLYHVTQPGKSMVSAGVGTYRGQGALAVGYSRLSDNGKVGIKFSVNSNSRGHAGAAASVGYQW